MYAITWKNGEDRSLDLFFDELRESQYSSNDRLSKNYSKHMMHQSIASTIVLDDNDDPILCSTIGRKEIWPIGVYRIYNRTWKVSSKRKSSIHAGMTPEMAQIGKSQIDWLTENTDCKLYFMSRETKNWRSWAIHTMKQDHGMNFYDGQYEYLTCENPSDTTCWQTIIYNGDFDVLKNWQHR
jgi:hypothetical protein